MPRNWVWNSKWKFEIPALLQNQNDRMRTEGEVAF